MSARFQLALAVALALIARAGTARAACTDAGACASNEYCATHAGDGGVAVTDGGAGVCLAEPCVVSSDCPSGDVCDTSQPPFACVPSPVQGDAGGGSDAGGDSGGASDAGEERDATLTPPEVDASSDASEASTPDASADMGSLAGGACDCTLATPDGATVAPLGASLALAVLALARRKRRSRATRAR